MSSFAATASLGAGLLQRVVSPRNGKAMRAAAPMMQGLARPLVPATLSYEGRRSTACSVAAAGAAGTSVSVSGAFEECRKRGR